MYGVFTCQSTSQVRQELSNINNASVPIGKIQTFHTYV